MMDEGREENRDRWLRMEELYHTALPLATTERHDFVAQRCLGDAALQEEVISLLVADDLVEDFLQEPIAGLGLAILADENLYDTELMSYPTQPASDDLAGTKIGGRYEVIKRLSGGGFGDVYKAADTKIMSRSVAIKVLKDDSLSGDGAKRDWVRKKFKQEMEVLAKVDDPGVVRIFDADTLPDGRSYIVMEFVEGSNLSDFIKQAKLKEVTEQGLKFQDVAEIVRQVGRTLTAVHVADIFHRDLKPENIMLRRNKSGDLQVKVIDFGIARVRNSLIAPSTATGLFVAGTWPYMSPEQLRGKKVGAACDIYALGVIAYEMLTGRCPFPAKDSAQLKEMQEAGIKVKPRDLNPDLPTAAQEALLKALSFYPGDRHEQARDFGDELSRALADDEDLVPPVPQPQPAPISTPWLRLHKRRVFAVSVLLLAGIISFAVWRALRLSEQLMPQQQQGSMPNAGPERTLTYWLTVQRKHDKEPFDSTGERIFDAGSKFWLNFQTTQAGALYLFSEGRNDKGETEWNTMFPTPTNNKGDAMLPANKSLRTAGFVFEDQRGVVKIWLVWAEQRIQLLDELVQKSLDRLPKEQGVISEPQRLQAFMEQHMTPQPMITLDKERFRITLNSRSDVLVDMKELEYQP